MMVFKNLISAAGILLMTSCITTIDYGLNAPVVEEKETIIEYIEVEVEPEVDVWVDSFTQVGAFDAIDIVWVIDKSCSMNSHNTSLLAGVEAMMNSLPIDVNWRLKMITAGSWALQATTFPLTRGDTPQDALDMLSQLPSDGTEAGFDAIKEYVLTDAYAQTWLRYDAAFLVVFVSDEEEQSTILVNDFISWYDKFRKGSYAASIINVEGANSVCAYPPSSIMTGFKYMEATNYFGGNVIDICESDWATAVEEATNEIEPYEDYALTHYPFADTIAVFADGEVYYDWHYELWDNRVYFDVIPEDNVHVEIGYAVEKYNYIIDHKIEIDLVPVKEINLSP
tara:strand:- start:137 stop:1153 length:1017 start_codon:yes stop_codon:yes gene_type:complete